MLIYVYAHEHLDICIYIYMHIRIYAYSWDTRNIDRVQEIGCIGSHTGAFWTCLPRSFKGPLLSNLAASGR